MTQKRYTLKLILIIGLAGLFLGSWLFTVRACASRRPAHVSWQVWQATADEQTSEWLAVLDQQSDLRPVADLLTREARLQYVYDTLFQSAQHSQAEIQAELDAAHVEYRPYYLVNMIWMRGDRALLERIAGHPAVARIAPNPHVAQPLPEPDDAQPSLTPRGVEWNIQHINADDVWDLGYTGQGIVVAGQDTGYDWDHPALIEQYRGYNGMTATHDYNWHDAIHENNPNTSSGNPCGFDASEPCDDMGHGTHTMGTMVGDDGGSHQIGVAPGAQWIGCRNMEQNWGTPTTYIECFEYFLAPYPVGGTPAQGEPSMAPHVINNSWYCPPREGCDTAAIAAMQTAVENLRAAGIMVVASAGNQGSSCSTVSTPPAMYDAAFSVGATNISDVIASFSSRGPVTIDGSNRMKPDVSAPGVGVVSSIPGGGYTSMSGTSMAGPHVAGMAALVWSAAPHLSGDVDATEALIAQTARPRTTSQGCGGDGPSDVPNNVYGWGVIDALAAVTASVPEGLAIEKTATFPLPLRPQTLVYTLQVTNTAFTPLTQVVVTDRMPTNAPFAWASGTYQQAGDTITWTFDELDGQQVVSASLGVTVSHLALGTHVVNPAYGVYANQVSTPVMGGPLDVVVPWRLVLPIVFRNGDVP